MTINGEPVSANEYRLVLERQFPGVYAYFQQTRNLEDHAGYWNEEQRRSPLAGPAR